MATPSAAAAPAKPAASSPASTAGATPVDDGLASILTGGAPAADPTEDPEEDPADPAEDPAEDPAADPTEDPAADPEDPESDDPAADPEEDPSADPEEDPEADPEEDPAADPEEDPADDKKKKDPLATDGQLDERIKRARAKFTPELQKVFDGVITQVRTRTSALETQLAQVTPELETLRQANEALRNGPAAAIDGGSPLAQFKTEAELAAHLAQVRKGRQWALRNPKGGMIKVVDDKGVVSEQEISEERVGDILAETEQALQVDGPAHQQFIRDRREWDRRLEAELPAAAKKDSPLKIQIDAALHRYPWLNQTAEGRVMAADLVIGAAVRAQNRAAKAKGPGGGKPGALPSPGKKQSPGNPPPAPGGQRPPKVVAKTKVNQERLSRFEKTGRDEGNAVLGAILSG